MAATAACCWTPSYRAHAAALPRTRMPRSTTAPTAGALACNSLILQLPCRIRLDFAGFLDGFGWFWLCRWRLRASAPPLRAPFQASERSGSVPPHTAAPCQRVLRDYRTVPEAAESIQAWLWCTTHGRMQGMEESTGPQLQAVYIVDLDQNLSFHTFSAPTSGRNPGSKLLFGLSMAPRRLRALPCASGSLPGHLAGAGAKQIASCEAAGGLKTHVFLGRSET